MSVEAKAHLIYGYKINSNMKPVSDEFLEQYEDFLIFGYDGLEFLGVEITSCYENELDILSLETIQDMIGLENEKITDAMEKMFGELPINSPKLYLTCLYH